MKKSLLALLLLPLIASCSIFGGGGSEEDDVNSEAGSKKLTIRFHVDTKNKEAMGYEKVIAAFNEAHAKDGVKVTATYVARTGSNDQYEQQLARDMDEGTLPDIVTFDSPNCARYAKEGFLYDVTNSFSEEEKSKFVTLNTYQNKIYGLPIQEGSAGFYYNKQIFAAAGVNVDAYTVDNPWTFEQFKAVCAQIRASGVLDANKAVVDMRMNATTDETATYLLYPFVNAAGGEFLDSTGLKAKGIFDSAKSINGFKFFKELVLNGYTNFGTGATDFFTGKVAMYLSGGWSTRECDYDYSTTFGTHDRGKWGVLPYPRGERNAAPTGSWSFGVTNNKREDKTLVIELLKFITSAASSKTIVDHTSMLPARNDTEFNYNPGDPEYTLRDQLQKSGIQRPETVGYPEFSATFGKVISELRSGDLNSVETIVHNKATELETLLSRV